MADWENLRHFLALAQDGSLSAAARRLGVEHATVARRVAALEAELSVKLVDRRGRRLALTADGERIAGLAGGMEREAQAVERAAAGARSALAGLVTLSAPPALAARRLAGPLADLQARHPALRLKILGESRRALLDRREADLAVRLGRPEAGELTIVKLGETAFRLYGAPAYLAATPPADWRLIGYDETMEDSPQQQALLRLAAGRPLALRASTAEIQLAAVRAGGGVALLADFMAEGEAGLAPAPTGAAEPLPVRGIWLALHSDLRNAAPIRAVVDCLRSALKPAGPEDARTV
ncbi:transcriptional regulator, LysR family [Tistlia consotensis]|uniref:Transcriptional regulator, LysR family n=1 Tax=Tistlia consotensis USBA 355 TaxID=560819 RepID=A0A1Y6CVG2_9PROT|nr:LysR family transcriptional regulator [Tistlia consotensis]SMF80961.1 transcriptional regulator, LysR family [Tistlia consotensis USBA 355]SNS22149.1 transcriptional regulator, LysR family [Tistlia consotensis]